MEPSPSEIFSREDPFDKQFEAKYDPASLSFESCYKAAEVILTVTSITLNLSSRDAFDMPRV